MPTPPYAKLRVAVNGGAPQTGALNVAAGNSIQLSAESTVGWTSAPRWEFYGYPPGWSAPAGWSTDASGVIYNTAVVPPAFTLPSVGGIWGKWLPRLIVNSSSIDPNTGAGTPLPQLVDSATAFQIASALGLKDLAQYEDKQFGPNWAKDHQANLRTLDAAIGALQAGQGGALTASGTITSGKVVVSVPSQPSKLQQFTIPAMLAGAQIRGIATSSATNGQTVTYGPNGSVVGNAVTGLGASTAGARVGVLTDGSLTALTRSFGGFEVGATDVSGNVSVATASLVKQSSMQPYNPVAYGAIPNDSSGPVQHSNLIAFNTMMGDIRRTSPNGHKVVIHDTFYLEDTWYITTPISTDSIGGGGFGGGTGTLIFPGNDEGLNLVYPNVAADGSVNGAQGAHLYDFGVNSSDQNTTIIPLWKPSTAYARNARVRFNGDPRYVYRCTNAVTGTSGLTVPIAFGAPEFTTPQRWSPGATYAVGKFIFPNRSSSQYGLVAYQVTSASGNTTPGTLGVAGTTQPTFPGVGGTVTTGQLVLTGVAFNTVQGGLQPKLAIVDNTATWIPEAICGVLVNSIVDIYRLNVSGWFCDAIHCYGDGLWSVCDFSVIRNVRFGKCAGGISTRGGDANAIYISGCTAIQVGASIHGVPLPGQIGHAFNDASSSGSVWSMCTIETACGRGYTAAPSNGSIFIGCASDGNFLGNDFRHYAIVVGGGDNGANFDNTSDVLGSRHRAGASNQYLSWDKSGVIPLYAGAVANDGKTLYPMSSANEFGGTSLFGWRYENFVEGWWFNTYSINGSTTKILSGISGTQCRSDGPANQWNVVGQFEGNPQHKIYVAVSQDFLTDQYVKYGQRNLGDLYRHDPSAVAGAWTHKIISEEGIVSGKTWAPGGSFVQYVSTANTPADTVTGAGTWVYECAKNGIAGGSNPFTSPTGDMVPRRHILLWISNVDVRPGDVFMATVHPDPSMAVQSYFEVEHPPIWSAAAPININTLIMPRVTTAPNDMCKDVYTPNVVAYDPAAYYQVGALVQPSPRTGTKAFRVASVPSPDGTADWDGAWSTTTVAGTEPIWDPVVGHPSTSGNGYTFTTVQLTTGGSQPVWAADPQIMSVIPALQGIPDGNFYWKKVTLNTGPVEPTWVRTSVDSLTPNPSAPVPFNFKKLGTFNDAAIVEDGSGGTKITWLRVGFEPKWNVYGKVESAAKDITPQLVRDWYDPNLALSAQRPRVRQSKGSITTTAVTADQIIDDGFGGGLLVEASGTVVAIDSVVDANQGSGTAGGTYRISSSFRNSGGVPTQIGATTVVYSNADGAIGAPTVRHKVVAGFIATVVTPANTTNTVWSAATTRTEA